MLAVFRPGNRVLVVAILAAVAVVALSAVSANETD